MGHPSPPPMNNATIRLAAPDDARFVSAVAVSSGLFPPDGTALTDKMMADYFGGRADEGHLCFVVEVERADDGPRRVGMAYVEPVRATDGTYELLMIAVDEPSQSLGHGRALLSAVEGALSARGARLLLVQTSGDDAFERTRTFYRRCAYDEATRIRDYYAPGADMVMFRKDLATARVPQAAGPSA